MDKRNIFQLIYAFITNGSITGFFTGKIFKGATKYGCVPGLNCYSCPGALSSCPIGSVQAVLGSRKYSFTFYVFGIMVLFGVVLGRFICGWLCPFGFFQDLLHKIPVKKLKIKKKIHKPMTFVKYAILLFFVILFPIFLTNDFGVAKPFFCQYVCPSGTFFGGLPLLTVNADLRQAIGSLFTLKISILIIIVALSIFVFRFFCKYLCPLGAFYALFNKISIYHLSVDGNKCIGCQKCVRACKMGVNVLKNPDSPECIRCLDCKKACGEKAISSGLKFNCNRTNK